MFSRDHMKQISNHHLNKKLYYHHALPIRNQSPLHTTSYLEQEAICFHYYSIGHNQSILPCNLTQSLHVVGDSSDIQFFQLVLSPPSNLSGGVIDFATFFTSHYTSIFIKSQASIHLAEFFLLSFDKLGCLPINVSQ